MATTIQHTQNVRQLRARAISCNLLKSVLHHPYGHLQNRPDPPPAASIVIWMSPLLEPSGGLAKAPFSNVLPLAHWPVWSVRVLKNEKVGKGPLHPPVPSGIRPPARLPSRTESLEYREDAWRDISESLGAYRQPTTSFPFSISSVRKCPLSSSVLYRFRSIAPSL